MSYYIQCRETGTFIDMFPTLADAQRALDYYEECDKHEGIYTKDFYEIVESPTIEIINN